MPTKIHLVSAEAFKRAGSYLLVVGSRLHTTKTLCPPKPSRERTLTEGEQPPYSYGSLSSFSRPVWFGLVRSLIA